MKTITYKFADGTINSIEVSEEFYSLYLNLEKADELSNRKQTRRTQSLERSLESGWDVVDINADIEAILEENENTRKLQDAILTLTPKQQMLLYKVFFERIPQKEIARQEGVSKVAINTRIARILKKLRKIL